MAHPFVARLYQKLSRLSAPPNKVVKIVRSASRICPARAPATRHLLPGWQARIILDPLAGRRAESGLGGSNGSVVGLSETHVQPHLVVGDVEAGQCLIPRDQETNQKLDPVAHDRQTGSEKPATGVDCRRPGAATKLGAFRHPGCGSFNANGN